MNVEVDDENFVYLSLSDALEIYAAIFKLNAEQAADHLRSQDVLEGALGRPASYAHYQQADVALQAKRQCSRTGSPRPNRSSTATSAPP